MGPGHLGGEGSGPSTKASSPRFVNITRQNNQAEGGAESPLLNCRYLLYTGLPSRSQFTCIKDGSGKKQRYAPCARILPKITPACARSQLLTSCVSARARDYPNVCEVTVTRVPYHYCPEDHPRLCGVTESDSNADDQNIGPSPRVRGHRYG